MIVVYSPAGADTGQCLINEPLAHAGIASQPRRETTVPRHKSPVITAEENPRGNP